MADLVPSRFEMPQAGGPLAGSPPHDLVVDDRFVAVRPLSTDGGSSRYFGYDLSQERQVVLQVFNRSSCASRIGRSI